MKYIIKIVSGILLIILIVFIILIYKDLNKNSSNTRTSSKEKNVKINIDDWGNELKENYYLLKVNIPYEVNEKKLNIYLLDDNNNLIHIIKNVEFEVKDTDSLYCFYEVRYDISKLNKVIISNDIKNVSFNEDITSSTKYIGNYDEEKKDINYIRVTDVIGN